MFTKDNNHVTSEFWTEQDWEDLYAAKSAAEMYVIGRRVLDRMPHGVVQVCGPIATGGLGTLEANLHAFNDQIKRLQSQGLHVFDQMPFEIPMQELKKDLKPGEYATSILDDFYLPLMQNDKVTTFYFMPNWETSTGARWEHDLVTKMGKEIKYL
jgi:hypothetical protein